MTSASEDRSCYSCRQEAAGEGSPQRERIVTTPRWRLVHAFNSTSEGWLVALPRRHVTTVEALTREESAELGPFLHRASSALHAELDCEKTYVMQFSEAEGFEHLHFHVVARGREVPAEHRGPNIFHYLRQPPEEWVTAERQEELAIAIARRLSS